MPSKSNENLRPRPSSPRRIAASRANGAKSHGPATDAGKAISSRNACKHGLASAIVVLSTEDWDNYLTLRDSYIARFRPADNVELDLVEEMVAARWRLQRAWAVESASIDDELASQSVNIERDYDQITPDVRTALAFKELADKSRSPHLLNRYEAKASRQFHRALKALRDLQAECPPAPPTPAPDPGPTRTAQNTILQNEPKPISGHSDAQPLTSAVERPFRAAVRRRPAAPSPLPTPPPDPASTQSPSPTAADHGHTSSTLPRPPADHIAGAASSLLVHDAGHIDNLPRPPAPSTTPCASLPRATADKSAALHAK